MLRPAQRREEAAAALKGVAVILREVAGRLEGDGLGDMETLEVEAATLRLQSAFLLGARNELVAADKEEAVLKKEMKSWQQAMQEYLEDITA